jgi:hypothetical protein
VVRPYLLELCHGQPRCRHGFAQATTLIRERICLSPDSSFFSGVKSCSRRARRDVRARCLSLLNSDYACKACSTKSLSVEQKLGKAGREDPYLFTRISQVILVSMQSRCSITVLAFQPCPNSRYRNIYSTIIGWCCYLCSVTQLRGVCSPDAIRRSCRLRLGPLALADFWIRYQAPHQYQPATHSSHPLRFPLQQVQVDFPASGYIDAHLSCHPTSLAFSLTPPV